MNDLDRTSMEAVRDRLQDAMRATPACGGGEQVLAMHLSSVLKCLRDGVYPFDVLLAADTAVDDHTARTRPVVVPPIVAYVSAAEALFLNVLREQFPDDTDADLRNVAAFKALTMSDVELLVLFSEDVEF